MKDISALAIQCLNGAAFVYLLACLTFIFAIARTGPAIQKWARIASWCVYAGFALHTSGMLMRWYVGGIGRPPWTNLYESLVFFAWGVVLFQVIAQSKWNFRLIGVVGMPLVLILMGMSVMTPNKLVEPLIPALQSNWLKIHVVFGMLSYGGFTTAACFAFLHLIRNKVSYSRIGAGLAVIALLNLGIAGGTEVLTHGKFYMAKTVMRELDDGSQVRVKDVYKEYEGGPVITRMEEVPFAPAPFYLSIALFLAAAVVMWVDRKGTTGGFDLKPLGKRLFMGGMAGMFALFAVIGWGVHNSETLTMSSNPYLVMLLSMTFFFLVMYVIVSGRYDRFVGSLPAAERLDELSYKVILFAFPFQTLLLITGAIWAYGAWGRSWGWDPKETWALITWFMFLIYLHGKLLMKWKPNFLSVWSICGFVILIFAFLGVNLVLSGLHSYGAA